MKININFTIEYDNPKNKKDQKELLKVIKKYYEENQSIPQTEKLLWKSIGTIGISVDIHGNNFEIQ